MITGSQDVCLWVLSHVRQRVFQPADASSPLSNLHFRLSSSTFVRLMTVHASDTLTGRMLNRGGPHQTVSTSETKMSKPMSVNVSMRWIFSLPCMPSLTLAFPAVLINAYIPCTFTLRLWSMTTEALDTMALDLKGGGERGKGLALARSCAPSCGRWGCPSRSPPLRARYAWQRC